MKRTVVSLGMLFAVGCGHRDPIRFLPVPPGYAQEPSAGSGRQEAAAEAQARVEAAARMAVAAARVERSVRHPAPAKPSRPGRPTPAPEGSGGVVSEQIVPVDLNLASLEQLQTLPRVGPAMAARIVARRPFHRVEELRRVKGIGAATYRAIRPRVAVSRAATAKQVH